MSCGGGKKLIAGAAERNKNHMLRVLETILEPSSKVLEISSGTGQHVIHFAANMPSVNFQPTEINSLLLESINDYIKESALNNVKCAEYLDVVTPPENWLSGKIKPETIDCVININMTHISHFNCTEGLFRGSAYVLKPNGLLFMYGPFSRNGIIHPESNVMFDKSLKTENPDWGLRDIDHQLAVLANKYKLFLERPIDMPANNTVLIWRKLVIQ